MVRVDAIPNDKELLYATANLKDVISCIAVGQNVQGEIRDIICSTRKTQHSLAFGLLDLAVACCAGVSSEGSKEVHGRKRVMMAFVGSTTLMWQMSVHPLFCLLVQRSVCGREACCVVSVDVCR